MTILLALIGASLAIMILVGFLRRNPAGHDEESVRFATRVYAFWLIASAVWGPYFYVLRIPGLFDISLDRLVLMAILAIMGLGAFTGRLFRHRQMRLELLMALFSLLCLLSMAINGFRPVNPSFPSPWNVFITGYLFPFIAFVFAKNYLTEEADIRFVLQALFYLGVYLAIISFFEFFGLRKYVYPQYINNPEIWLHLDRARGPFLNSAFNGIALIVGLACGIHLASEKEGFGRILHLALLALFFPAVFFTLTRSIYLGFLIVMTLFLFFYRTSFPKWRVLALPLAVVMVFLLTQTPKLASKERREGGVLQVEEVAIRMALLQRSFLIFADYPLSGVGLAQFIPVSVREYRGRVAIPESTQEHTQHNHLLGMLVELGVAGTFLYLAIVVLIFRRLFQAAGRQPPAGMVSANLLLLIGSVLAAQLNNNLFVVPSYCLFVNIVFFAFGGIADGLYDRFAGVAS